MGCRWGKDRRMGRAEEKERRREEEDREVNQQLERGPR